jgi:hypothetical protein
MFGWSLMYKHQALYLVSSVEHDLVQAVLSGGIKSRCLPAGPASQVYVALALQSQHGCSSVRLMGAAANAGCVHVGEPDGQ